MVRADLSIEVVSNCGAGGAAGAAGVVAGQPLDTVRIRLQQPGHGFSGALACLRATVAKEGPRALFRGLTYPLASVSFQVRATFVASRYSRALLQGAWLPD